MRTINGLDELRALAGQELGVSDWHEVTQEAIDAFADVTGDRQFIHVDVERARDTPLGGTIAHGYYTLSLGPGLAAQVFDLQGVAMALNYGLNKVRFPSPLPVGNRVRARIDVIGAEDIPGGAQVTFRYTFERDGGDKPVCVAETLARIYAG